MSERMIERERAKLGLPPTGLSPAAQAHNSTVSPVAAGMSTPQSAAVPRTAQQRAADEVLSEDARLQRFIHRLQRRDDSHPIEGSVGGPTVPTALARRILHRQGVGYMDDTVAAAISASADRFLATVFQQAKACRDQRLKGAEMAREAARHKKRHMQHYQEDSDDRKRRKQELHDARENVHLKAIAAADALKKGASKDGDDKKSKKKKKKVQVEEEPQVANGVKPAALKDLDGDDESYDSIDEEENYYQERLGEVKGRLKGDDEEDDDTLVLRDIVRPLEAWDFHLTGKEALEVQDPETDEEDGEDEDEEKADNAGPHDAPGNEEGLAMPGLDMSKGDGKNGEDGDNDGKRKVAPSPVQPST